jgi:tripartite ATP-independent transporter DctM subunit
MFGILADVSIGKLFIAGIIPGLILAAAFIIQIIIQCRLKPTLAPAGERSRWDERLRGLPVFGPVVFLFLVIIGGIYAGVFSAMEGGGIGAFMALVIALALRRVTWSNFKIAITDSMKFICMIFLVIIGGLVFGNALGASGITNLLIDFLIGLGVTPMVFLAIVIFIYILWGIICDAAIIVILTVPILAPIAEALGIDLIWFGILTTVTVGLGSLTPPFAMGIFVLRAVALPDVSLGVMYRGIIPFCITTVVVIILILFFPAIATWLPGLMF